MNDLVFAGLDGDFDGDVDGADFLKWQRDLSDATSLGLWQDNFGNVAAVRAASAVFEPTSFALAVLAIGWLAVGARSRHMTL